MYNCFIIFKLSIEKMDIVVPVVVSKLANKYVRIFEMGKVKDS